MRFEFFGPVEECARHNAYGIRKFSLHTYEASYDHVGPFHSNFARGLLRNLCETGVINKTGTYVVSVLSDGAVSLYSWRVEAKGAVIVDG